MSTVKEHANQSTNRLILILFCTIQFVAFLGLTVYETKHRQDLQANLELKRAAIRNISSTCLRIDLLKEKIGTISRLKRDTEKYLAGRQSSGSNPDQTVIKTEETLLEKSCGNDTKICLKGLKGEVGNQGDQGNVGVTGLAGPTGPKGIPGVIGPKGKAGLDGSSGPKGIRGLKGLSGNQGSPGEKGATGEPGERGERGLVGGIGKKGEIGSRGSSGDIGMKGVPGDKGDIGPSGMNGEKGPAGDIGEPGESGTMSQNANSSCDCVKKVRYTDTTTTISAPLGSAIKLDCSTTQPLHVNTSHTSEQQCYQDNGSGVIDIQRLSSVDAGDHVCVVNNGLTDVVKVIHVEATGSSDGLTCDFDSPCTLNLVGPWKSLTANGDHTSGTGLYVQTDGQTSSSLESLWVKKATYSCLSLWYKTSQTGTSPSGTINIEFQEPVCANHSFNNVIPLQTNVTTWTELSIYVPQSFDLFKALIKVKPADMLVSIDDLKLFPNGCPNGLKFNTADNQTIEIPEGNSLSVNCEYVGGPQVTRYAMNKEGSCSFTSKSSTNYQKTSAAFSDSGKYDCHLNGLSGTQVNKRIDVIVTGNHLCTLESGLCDWTQDSTDSLDWTLHSSTTPSKNTGPSADHTTGSGKYLYIEASSKNQGQKAVLRSTLLPVSSGHYCLSFAYHMYGTAMGTLKVSTQECSGKTEREIWEKTGDQGNTWQNFCMEIPQPSNDFSILIEGIRGSDFTSDIAIDDINLSSISRNNSCLCSNNASNSYGRIITTCNFDTDFCNWIQSKTDDFDWSRGRGQTSSTATGPLHDHTTWSGSYIYTEASAPRRPSDKAELESITLLKGTQHCLTFYYNMYGAEMGQLNILRKVKSTGAVYSLFKISGNHGSQWHKQQVNIPSSTEDFNIILQGIRGSGITSDIAVDDVVISEGTCV